ncbi:Gfo/Idh/MocA family protein [Kribbella catacumbae]|uniref:Gfo/Idh/MocA family protein n=1 Tax=Kribbella catacumbae TaxID=460086 RepID=UPI00037FD22B|nr:Gfo/Idh/MocA family oxidoreductase [Kribbella catacumbae]
MRRVAIAGAAHPHVEYVTRELSSSRDFELVGVSDPSTELARACADPFGARVFADHRELFAATEPDVVVAAGIYGTRGGIIVDALNLGCHVVADKPLCTTAAELEAISAASTANQRSVTMLLEKRYYPETVAALEIVRSGRLGALVELSSTGPHKLNPRSRPAWFFDRRAYGGILNDLLTHDLDLALLLTQATSGTISGTTAGSLPERSDFALCGAATVRTPDHLILLEANWLTPAASAVHGDYHLRLIGTEGVADLWWARHQLTLTTNNQATSTVELGNGSRPAELTFEHLARGAEPPISTSESLAAARLALLAQESADGNGTARSWSIGR